MLFFILNADRLHNFGVSLHRNDDLHSKYQSSKIHISVCFIKQAYFKFILKQKVI